MSAIAEDTIEPLTKVDSAVAGLGTSPPQQKGHRRQSSSCPGVFNVNDLGELDLRQGLYRGLQLMIDRERRDGATDST